MTQALSRTATERHGDTRLPILSPPTSGACITLEISERIAVCKAICRTILFVTLVLIVGNTHADPMVKPIVVTGDSAPEGGVFIAETPGGVIGMDTPSMNNTGQIVFSATLTATTQGTDNDSGVFMYDDGALIEIARENDPVANETNFLDDLMRSARNQLLYERPAVDDAGNVFFWSKLKQGVGSNGLFEWTDGSLEQPFPGGSTTAEGAIIVDDEANRGGATTNALSHIVGIEAIDDGQLRAGLLVSGGDVPSIIARSGEIEPNGNGAFDSFKRHSIGDDGVVAFQARIDGNSTAFDGNGIFVYDGGDKRTIAQRGQITPDGAGTYASSAEGPIVNNQGQIVFSKAVDGPLDRFDAIFLADASGNVTEVVREGDSLTSADIEARNFHWFDINDSGDVVFMMLADTDGIFLHKQGNTETIALEGQRAPEDDGSFSVIDHDQGAINNKGEVAFWASVDLDDDTFAADQRIYVYRPGEGLDLIVSEGQSLLGSTITRVLFRGSAVSASPTFGKEYSGFNDVGQVAFYFELADGRTGIAFGFGEEDILVPDQIFADSFEGGL